MIAWPDVEAALQGRPGWRRVGREYHGPCPVSGAGRDCCFASEGRAGDVALGCRKCGGNGGKLDSESFLAHLAALGGETARHVAAHATNDRAAIATPSALPGRAWRASEPVDGTPGARYLLVTRQAWPTGERFPASVRWLPTESARRVGVRPRVPDGAAGCVVYRFGSPGEADTNAAQLEAVNAHGERVPFGAAGKRPSVAGSAFAGGRRVFHAGGDVDRGVHLVEGPLDALALVHLARLGAVELAGAVFGAQGTPGFTASACPGRGPVVLWPDGDGPGERAAVRAKRALRRAGRDVAIRLCGSDVTAWAVEFTSEREAIQDE